VSSEERERFFELVCSGLSLAKSVANAGVSAEIRGVVVATLGSPRDPAWPGGGMPGSAPARVPGAAETGAPPRAAAAVEQ